MGALSTAGKVFQMWGPAAKNSRHQNGYSSVRQYTFWCLHSADVVSIIKKTLCNFLLVSEEQQLLLCNLPQKFTGNYLVVVPCSSTLQSAIKT